MSKNFHISLILNYNKSKWSKIDHTVKLEILNEILVYPPFPRKSAPWVCPVAFFSGCSITKSLSSSNFFEAPCRCEMCRSQIIRFGPTSHWEIIVSFKYIQLPSFVLTPDPTLITETFLVSNSSLAMASSIAFWDTISVMMNALFS